MNVFVGAVLLVICLNVALASFFLWSKIRQVDSLVWGFLSPPAPDKPSQFAEFVDLVSQRAGNTIATQLRASLMNAESLESRRAGIVDRAIAEDSIAQSNPLMAGLLGSFPRLRKALTKNPELIQAVLNKLGDMPSSNNNHSGKSDYGQQLAKYK